MKNRFAGFRAQPIAALAAASSLLITMGSAPQAWAADGGNTSLGLLAGVTLPSTSSTAFTYGITGSYRFVPAIPTGIFLLHYGVGLNTAGTGATNSLSADSSFTYYGIQGGFQFAGSGVQAGLKLGLAKSSTTATATSASGSVAISAESSGFAVAPYVSYDRFVGGSFSIGGELSYIKSLKDTVPSGLALLASGKFWF